MRTLKAEEIDVRVGSHNRNGDKASLLLYKDARCDMAILDETYGAENWQSRYERIGDVLYCSIGVYNVEIEQWVWKTSNGIESKGTGADDPNNVKGEASDAFKRAGFMWGIGRELYEWSGIWVEHDKEKDKYADYKVTEIEYDEFNKPLSIVITKNGNICYELRNGYYKKHKSNETSENKPTSDFNKNGSKDTKKQEKSHTSENKASDDISTLIKEKNIHRWKELITIGRDIMLSLDFKGETEEMLEIIKKELNSIVTNELKLNFKNIEILQAGEKPTDNKHVACDMSDLEQRLELNLKANYTDWSDDIDETIL